MPKTEKTVSIGEWKLMLFPEKTREAYRALMPYAGHDTGLRMFHYLLKDLPSESARFFDEIGVDPRKILCARPISEVQEDGSVLFLAKARLCGGILEHSLENGRRKSEEIAGMSVVFVAQRDQFCPDYPSFDASEIELRCVLALPFDRTFFDFA